MLRQWNDEMQKAEGECPNTFSLSLGISRKSKRLNPKNWVSQEYRLHRKGDDLQQGMGKRNLDSIRLPL